MNSGIVVKISDQATPAIKDLARSLDSKQLAKDLGEGLQTKVQNHLLSNGTNKHGWPTTNFWAKAARATSWSEHPEGVLISINKIGVRQRVFGGTIRPVNARALTIPISPVSYGHLASEFPGLFLIRTAKGAYLVQRGEELSQKTGRPVKRSSKEDGRQIGGNNGRRIRANLNFMFKLVSSVDQEPNPNAIPSNAELGAEALAIIKEQRP